MGDLAEKIISAIEAREQFAHRHKVAVRDPGPTVGGNVAPLVALAYGYDPDDTLRGCAASREILARHRPLPAHGRFSEDEAWECDEFCSRDEQGQHELVCATCRNYAGDHEEAPCGDLLALARGYGIQP